MRPIVPTSFSQSSAPKSPSIGASIFTSLSLPISHPAKRSAVIVVASSSSSPFNFRKKQSPNQHPNSQTRHLISLQSIHPSLLLLHFVTGHGVAGERRRLVLRPILFSLPPSSSLSANRSVAVSSVPISLGFSVSETAPLRSPSSSVRLSLCQGQPAAASAARPLLQLEFVGQSRAVRCRFAGQPPLKLSSFFSTLSPFLNFQFLKRVVRIGRFIVLNYRLCNLIVQITCYATYAMV